MFRVRCVFLTKREREKDDDENIFRVFSEISENPSHKSIERRGKRERDEESSRTEKEKKKRRKDKRKKKIHTQQVSSHSPLPSSSRHTFP